MGWTSPRTFTAGEIITAAILNTHVRDNFSYLKGVGQVPTIQSGLIIDNTLGTEYLKLPLLSTIEASTVLNAAGEVAYDEATNRIKMYGATLNSVVTTADVSSTPTDAATTVPISSDWAYDHLNILTTAGDILYATAAGTWARLPIGTAGQRLRTNAGATAPEWAAGSATKEFMVLPSPATNQGAAANVTAGYPGMTLDVNVEACFFAVRIPADFTVLTSANVVFIAITTGTIDWTATTAFAAGGQVYNTHTDSATADGLAVTNTFLQELDISAAFTGIAVNDIIGLTFTVDVFTTTTSITVIGLNVKYS